MNQDKEVCIVCDMAWADHGLGGNCLTTPYWTHSRKTQTPRPKKRPKVNTRVEIPEGD